LIKTGSLSIANLSLQNREVSARDIVSGIISAANRKIQRSSHSGSAGNMASSTGSLPGANLVVKSTRRDVPDQHGVQRLDTPTRALVDEADASGSRRNSESVIHGAMAIAAAVPKLLESGAGGHSRDSSPRRPFQQQQQQRLQLQQQISASAESLNRPPPPPAMRDEPQLKAQAKSPFPFDTYQGLQVRTIHITGLR